MRQEHKYKPNTAISMYEFGKRFPNAETARLYIEQQKWQGKAFCAFCNSVNVRKLPSKNGFYQCNTCRKKFNVCTNTIFQSSNIPLDKWLYAFYIMVTARKGVSSMQLSKELGITQKSAWFMCHRVRYAMSSDKYKSLLKGVVECDETYIGGKEKNKHNSKKTKQGRGGVGKIPVFGIVERGGKALSIAVNETTSEKLQGLIEQNVAKDSVVNTDEARAYLGLEQKGYSCKRVNHSAKVFVDNMASTNGIESVWALLKRGFYGTFHKFSGKHLQRYVDEFDFRWNEGNCKYPTMSRVDSLANGCFGRNLPYKVLIGKNNLISPK